MLLSLRRSGMLRTAIYGMIYLGSALMVYNIYGFVSYTKDLLQKKKLKVEDGLILYLPIVLLVLFLLGYLAVGFFGKPDIIVSGILFGGSVFVFLIYKYIDRITRRIIEEEELQSKLVIAEENNRIKTNFLATMSHEMRTPMNVIIGLDDIALKNPDIPLETRSQLQSIGYSARHLLAIINNILEINRKEDQEFDIKHEPFSLRDVLGQVNAITQSRCNEKGLNYHEFEKGSIGDKYVGDELRLSQILFSILDNSIKYTDSPGNVSFTARVVSDDGETRVLEFKIQDSGIGIDSDFLSKVFDAFSQEDDSATSRYGGSGLGMAVTKDIVERMQGSISVESEKGNGALFTVTIPLKIAEHEVQAEAYESLSLAGKRILIVEDIDMNAEIVEDLLDLEDIVTERAENGLIAVNMVSASPEHYYDAILMDLRMPVMDGLEATRTIRALERPDAKTVPIIALTANAFEEDVKKSLAAGMNAHLAKPTDADLLYAVLKKYIYLETH